TPAPTNAANFTRTYPDLRHGQFRVLADCNSADQATRFRVVDSAGSEAGAQPTISARHSRDETGHTGLQATLASTGERLVFDNTRAGGPAWIRDWSPYHLLLMSVYGPGNGAKLEFAIESDGGRSSRCTLFARPGWNLFRIDLSDIADEADVANVSAL